MYIEKTNNLTKETKSYSLHDYMIHVEEYFKIKELNGNIDKKRIYLVTNEPKLFFEAKNKYINNMKLIKNTLHNLFLKKNYRYLEYDIIGGEDVSKSTSTKYRYSNQSLSDIIIDIHLLSLCDFIVCTFSSRVINKLQKSNLLY